MNNWTCRIRTLICLTAISLLGGCGPSPIEIRSLLSYQDVWDTAKSERPFLARMAHEVAVRTDSFRQAEISQALAKNKINDVIALLEYEGPGWNLKGIYTVFVVTRSSAYRIQIFDHGRDVASLIVPENEVSEFGTCIETLRNGYKGDHIMCGNDLGLVFMTIYGNKKPMTMFLKYKPILAINRIFAKRGSPQMQAFYRICEILLLAQTKKIVSEATDLEYPYFGCEHVK